MSNRDFSQEKLEQVLHAAFNQCEFAHCTKDAVYKIKIVDQELREKYCAEHYLWELQHSHTPELMADATSLSSKE